MKVKICVVVDKYGGWRCDGWADRMQDGGMNVGSDEEVMESAKRKGNPGAKAYWILAEIPDPPPWFFGGKVIGSENL